MKKVSAVEKDLSSVENLEWKMKVAQLHKDFLLKQVEQADNSI
jgi:hypothetical protein